MNYTLENFISYCDDMMIAEEGLKDTDVYIKYEKDLKNISLRIKSESNINEILLLLEKQRSIIIQLKKYIESSNLEDDPEYKLNNGWNRVMLILRLALTTVSLVVNPLLGVAVGLTTVRSANRKRNRINKIIESRNEVIDEIYKRELETKKAIDAYNYLKSKGFETIHDIDYDTKLKLRSELSNLEL